MKEKIKELVKILDENNFSVVGYDNGKIVSSEKKALPPYWTSTNKIMSI